MRSTVVVVLCFLAALTATPALAERRVALVIGNSQYTSVPVLPNPDADAAAIAASLQDTGFQVILRNDLDQKGMATALADFATALVGADVGLFYYAGHAIQYDSQNYLVSTNAELANPFALNSDAIPLAQIVATMQALARVNVVLLDACRNNPFVDRLKQSLPASRSLAVSRGLARVDVDASDTMIVYATSANQTAADGTGSHSPFTQALLDHIGTPGLEVSLVMKRVIQDVRDTTQRQQNPEVLSRMATEFYFVPGAAVAAAPPASESYAEVTQAFRRAMAVGSAEAWRDFVTRYPDSSLAGFARDALARIESIRAGKVPGDVATLPAAEPRSGVPDTAPANPPDLPLLKTPAPAEAAQRDPAQLALLIQTELNRLGCNVGTPDGVWGKRSAAGLSVYARETGQPGTELALSDALLVALQGQSGRICPLACSATETVRDGQCVRKTCPAGQRLSSKGVCYVPVAATPKKPPVRRPPVSEPIETVKPRPKLDLEDMHSLCDMCSR